MRKILFFALVAIAAMTACTGQKPAEEPATKEDPAEQDTMIYGLTCDGTNDSVIVFLPLKDDADPVTYNIETAKAMGKIIGQPQIGDWIGILVNPEDTTEATMAVDLDELKGTWTYSVRPTWKDASKLSRRALARKLNEIPDSMREAYMVPREYGFTLKRSSVAQPVGRVMSQSSLEDDSPVEYPEVKNYTKWKCRNGHLFLTHTVGEQSTKAKHNAKQAKPKELVDTLEFVFMTQDSLVMMTHQNVRMAFHRKSNSMSANAEAQKAVSKTTKKDIK